MTYIWEIASTVQRVEIVTLMVVLEIMIFILARGVYSYFSNFSISSTRLYTVYAKMDERSKARNERASIQRSIKGVEEDKNLLARIDRIITYSGITAKVKWLNTEVIVTMAMILSIVNMVAVISLTRSFILGMAGLLGTSLIIYVILVSISNKQNLKVENQLKLFMSAVQNCSSSTNDIITVFSKVSRDLEEPLGPLIRRCVSEATYGGSKEAAMKRLEDSVENPYFKMIIRNLSACSSIDANYVETIESCTELVDNYTKQARKIRESYRSGRVEMLTMLAMCVIIVIGASAISEQSLMATIREYGNTGKALELTLLATVLVTIYMSFIGEMRN